MTSASRVMARDQARAARRVRFRALALEVHANAKNGGAVVTAAAIRDALRCDRPRCACQRGRAVHCPAHPDRSPSFVVDEAGTRLLVHCHGGCDQRAVIAALLARQLWPGGQDGGERRRGPATPLAQARREIRREARRQLSRLPLELYQWSDEIRRSYQLVASARRVATALGDRDEAWDLLGQAALLETATLAAEAAE